MYDWCHSGLEGYCKSAASMLADQVEEEEAADNNNKKSVIRKAQGDQQLRLCRDLLPDRTEETLTRAWTLSNVRRGRDCRQSLFEKCWLGDELWQKYLEEAKLLSKGVVPEGGYVTIPPESDYERELKSCAGDSARKLAVNSMREAKAIEACAQRVVDSLLEDDWTSDPPMVISLIEETDFPVRFFTIVVPAIERGLLSERYRSSDIRQFVLTLNETIFKAHRDLMKYRPGEEEAHLDDFLRFLITLFAGLIYGPNHPYAISRPWNVTPSASETDDDDNEELREGTTIRVTQVFNDSGRYTGYSELFRPGQVVFFGRDPVVDKYLTKCRDVFPDDSDALRVISDCEKVIFPIAYHDAVSNCHAVLLCQGDAWWLYDLKSTNGTSIASDDGIVDVATLSRVAPGDRMRLGRSAKASGANVYYDAATMLITLNVDLTEDYI